MSDPIGSPTNRVVEVTSYMMRLAGVPVGAPRTEATIALFKDLRGRTADDVAVLFITSLMMQVGIIELLAQRVGVPMLDTEALVTMMAQQALANDVN